MPNLGAESRVRTRNTEITGGYVPARPVVLALVIRELSASIKTFGCRDNKMKIFFNS
jgi:hypothetical protein